MSGCGFCDAGNFYAFWNAGSEKRQTKQDKSKSDAGADGETEIIRNKKESKVEVF